MKQERPVVGSPAGLPPKPRCTHLTVELKNFGTNEVAGLCRELHPTLSARYFTGSGHFYTAEHRDPARLARLLVALAGKGHRLEYETRVDSTGTEGTLTFYATPAGRRI